MDKKQSNKMSMIEGVNAFLSEHEIVFNNDAGLKETAIKLSQKINEINARENIRVNILKGKKEAKQISRDYIITRGLSVASKLFDYATESGNSELKAVSDYTRSGIRKVRDTELLIILDTIRENASVNLESLAQYGLTQEKLDTFTSDMERYQTAIDRKKSSEAVKISSKKTLSALFTEAGQILRRLDKMVEEYHDTDSQFYNGYKSARNIKDLGIRHKPEDRLKEVTNKAAAVPKQEATQEDGNEQEQASNQ